MVKNKNFISFFLFPHHFLISINHFLWNMTIELIARAVVISNDKLLLCRKVGALWYFLPGGHVEFGEETKTALAREIKEELGVESAVGDFIGIVENIFEQDKKERHEINLVFEVKIAEIDLSSKEDHIEFVWIAKKKLPEEQIYPVALKASILQWLKDKKMFWKGDIPDKRLFQCPECGLAYREKEWAQKCEAWCRKHKSCNLEIIKHAITNKDNQIEEGQG